MHKHIIILMLALLVSVRLGAGDWPQYRGPNQNGVTHIEGLPTTWSAQSRIWKCEIPGWGASQPVVKDGRIYVTSFSGYGMTHNKGDFKKDPGDPKALKLHLTCVAGTDGKQIWTKEIAPLGPVFPPRSSITLHGYATPSPVVDGDMVYASYGSAGVFACKTADGEKVWDMVPGEITHHWGSAASLVTCGDLLIINASSEANTMIAVDKMTGKETWRNDVGMVTKSEHNRSWSTPLVLDRPGGGKQIVCLNLSVLCAYNPDDGKTLWTYRTNQGYSASTPTWEGDIIYAITGSGHGQWNSHALKMKEDGVEQLWHNKDNGTGFCSAVKVGDYIYYSAFTAKERPSSAVGFCCMNAKTGEIVYKEKPENAPKRRKGQGIFAAALAGDGKVYYVTMDGNVYVVDAKPEFRILAINKLEDDETWFNPPLVPLAGGHLLLRSDWGLHCVK